MLDTAGKYYDRVAEGAKTAFSSGQAAGDFLGNNKMNLAMSGAPLLLPEEQEPIAGRDAYIRPYSLEIDNTSGIAASPVGREDERLRYRYTAGTPYKAAKGGIIAFAIVTETVFQWPGMGLLFIQAVQFADIPVMAAYLCLISFIFVLINLIVDLLYFAVDPRLRAGLGKSGGGH